MGDIILTFNGVGVNKPSDIRKVLYENDIQSWRSSKSKDIPQ